MPANAATLEQARSDWEKSKFFLKDIHSIPLIEEHTTYFPAGVVSLGLEARSLDYDILKAHLANYGQEMDERRAAVNDGGPSIHVVDPTDGFEYLRFDCFAKEPHYHYLVPGLDSGVTYIVFDRAAHGDDFVAWVYRTLRTRMREMLIRCGADHLADQLDDNVINAAVDQLEARMKAEGL